MRTQTLPLALVLALGAIVGPAAAQGKGSLSKVERKIASAVDAHNEAALELLIRVVNMNSGTMHFAGVRQVGDVFRAQFDSLGFTTRWVDGSAFGRAGHLVAEHPGPGPKLLLIGHLDTVFPPESPFQKFERLDDSTARGPGIIDMKGGDVIVVYALRALKDAGLLDKMNIVVVFDGDEEDSGAPLSEARRALTDAAPGTALSACGNPAAFLPPASASSGRPPPRPAIACARTRTPRFPVGRVPARW